MAWIDATLHLKTRQQYGSRVPPVLCGRVLTNLAPLFRGCVRLAFEGRSVANGVAPVWLKNTADVRFTGLSANGDTALHFSAPDFGTAAADLYKQSQLEWCNLPGAKETAIDLLAATVAEIREQRLDSTLLDRNLLRRVGALERLMRIGVTEVGIPRSDGAGCAIIDWHAVHAATQLSRQVPRPRPVRVLGTLDMVRVSTQAFALKLLDGTEVHAVFVPGSIDAIAPLLGRRVLAVGQAIYRPSGGLLRIDARAVVDGATTPELFSRIPPPAEAAFDATHLLRRQTAGTGIAALLGTWPGDETEEELLKKLAE